MSNNWLLKNWPEAVQTRVIFTNSGITETHLAALTAWDTWNRDEVRGDDVTTPMEEAIKEYLEKAAAVKKMINTQLWNFCGLRWKLGQWDIAIYYALVSLIFVFKGTLAFVEDYPGGVKKPSQVWWIDFATVIADFIFVLLQSFKPDNFDFWHAGTGITGFASKVGRAYIIASYTTPLTPISTTRDRFNAFGPAVVTRMKAVLALMALPREKLPLAGPGEPFSSLVNSGKGLTNADRCKLLGEILSSPFRVRRPDANE